ncbi:MAG: hypothetical protein HYX79_09150 [Chloroflexi bacterium]|nr:hypothetical protein [Chloroflexota bacterium]
MNKKVSKMIAFIASSGIALWLGQFLATDLAQTTGNMTLADKLRSPSTPFYILGLVVILGILYWFVFLRHDESDDIAEIRRDITQIKKALSITDAKESKNDRNNSNKPKS